ncbi:hypothetical protein HK098_001993 [Nowakowskiella sp. JEL0407]|nr:hypothetical protein HK098_001993 [Nowakowskiella sp. JEL0407]
MSDSDDFFDKSDSKQSLASLKKKFSRIKRVKRKDSSSTDVSSKLSPPASNSPVFSPVAEKQIPVEIDEEDLPPSYSKQNIEKRELTPPPTFISEADLKALEKRLESAKKKTAAKPAQPPQQPLQKSDRNNSTSQIDANNSSFDVVDKTRIVDGRLVNLDDKINLKIEFKFSRVELKPIKLQVKIGTPFEKAFTTLSDRLKPQNITQFYLLYKNTKITIFTTPFSIGVYDDTTLLCCDHAHYVSTQPNISTLIVPDDPQYPQTLDEGEIQGDGEDKVLLQLQASATSILKIKVEKNNTVGMLAEKFLKKSGVKVEVGMVRFRFDGEVLDRKRKLSELDLVDEDCFDVLIG